MSDSPRVCVSWWPPTQRPGGRAQAIRGNVIGFLDAGFEVDMWFRDDLIANADEVEDRYDLLVVPYIDVAIEMDIPVHIQIGGYGSPQLDDQSIRGALDVADSVSVLDPRLAFHLNDRAGLDLDRASIIPNAPNTELFDPQDWSHQEGHVLVPKVGGPYKRPDILNPIAWETTALTYRAFSGPDPPGVADNVAIQPAVPLSGMPDVYGAASLVFNASERDGLPNVVYESFCTERPLVATPRGIGFLQTIPVGALDVGDFGTPASWFAEEYRTLFNEGQEDHYVTASESHLAVVLRDLMSDPVRRRRLAKRGRAWIDGLGYTWADKAELIVETAIG